MIHNCDTCGELATFVVLHGDDEHDEYACNKHARPIAVRIPLEADLLADPIDCCEAIQPKGTRGCNVTSRGVHETTCPHPRNTRAMKRTPRMHY